MNIKTTPLNCVCANLQDFPDGFTQQLRDPNSYVCKNLLIRSMPDDFPNVVINTDEVERYLEEPFPELAKWFGDQNRAGVNYVFISEDF